MNKVLEFYDNDKTLFKTNFKGYSDSYFWVDEENILYYPEFEFL